MSEIEKPLSIPSHWTWTTFDGIGSWTGGGTPSKRKDEYWDGDIPWVSPKDMKRLEIEDAEDHITSEAVAESSAKMIPAGSLLFVTRSGILEHTLPTAAAKVDLTINQDLKALTPHGNADTAFLLHYTRAVALPILRACSKDGTTVASLESERLYNYPVPVPPLPEQRRIVDKIEELFSNLHAGVVSLKTARRQVDRYRQSVLQAAVEGRLTADWRQSHAPEPAEVLLERILEERRAQWEKDYRAKYEAKGKEPPSGWKKRYKEPEAPDTKDLPELPEVWVWVRLDTVSSSRGGYAFRSKNYTESGRQIIKIGNVKEGHLDLSVSPSFVRSIDAKTDRKYSLRTNDIVITLTGSRFKRDYGHAAIIEGDNDLLLNQRVGRLRSYPCLEPNYFFYFLRTQLYRRQFFGFETGNVGQGNVSMKALRETAIPVPSLAEQKQIVAEVERLLSVADDTAATIDRELQRAERLRQSILKQAFSGKLVAPDPDGTPAPQPTAEPTGQVTMDL